MSDITETANNAISTDLAEASPDPALDSFGIAEFDALRREIELHIGERRRIENQVILGLSIIYSWLFTRDIAFPEYLFKAGLCVPVVLVFLGFVRWIAIQLRTMKLGEYLRQVERELGKSKIGWERFLANDRQKRPFVGRFEGWSEIIVWGTLIVLSVLVFFFVPAPIVAISTQLPASSSTP